MSLGSEINRHIQKGSIEIICGSMFSGKTEELLRRIRRVEYAKIKIMVFKPVVDARYDAKKIVSHNKNTTTSIPVKEAKDILKLAVSAQVIAIDEVQFFDNSLITVCNDLANKGKRLILAGLDMDFLGNPFGIMPKLLAIAEYVTKVHAICVDCGGMANHSFRKTRKKDLIQRAATPLA